MVSCRWTLYHVAACSLLLTTLLSATVARPAEAEAGKGVLRITVLYDAFGKRSSMKKDWGYSALIEYGSQRILFDTGGNPEILANNAKAKGIDLARLDFVVLSHRHGDHMGGLDSVLRLNPNVKIYAPKENFGVYGFSLPGTFYRRDESLPPEQRYFDGAPPSVMKFGSAWPHAHFQLIESTTKIAPGVHLISLVSEKAGTLELRELSLAIETPEGIVLVVGCSHPGIENILAAATSINSHVRLVAGGLHLLTTSDAEIGAVVTSLHERWKVDYIAPGHCTGEPAFTALERAFRDRYWYAGLGTQLTSGTPAGSQAAR